MPIKQYLPPGYGTFTQTWTVTGGPHDMVNVWGFSNVGNFTAAGALSNLSAAFNAAGRLTEPAGYANVGHLYSQYVLLNVAGTLYSSLSVTNNVGTATFDPPSPAVSMIVNKHTAIAGRKFRGRASLPNIFIDEADLSAGGAMDPGYVALYQASANLTLAAAASNNVPLMLVHSYDDAAPIPILTFPTTISALTVNPIVGSQRKRQR